ncbi:hypothetical protein [Pseudonocardia charpentierae]|uniref:Uncharacterized protein n=1 Tax=Pseudonocardia charpentierae TaxID=3075545 RepID=A0ABU2N6M6_9PSEU|nr:hypothetical protein [Pseudonocardia sp. DSM 45834]MDT0349534.1 hypothetical protein [Pseudonocardia sp. DSM 45834]
MSTTVSALGARLAYTDLAVERSGARRGELEFAAEVVPGVTVTWDPATPARCVALSIGNGSRRAAPDDHRDVDRTPWLRLAAVTMLDHRLYLPLNRALLNAEIAVAQVGAARTLARGEPTRRDLIDGALVRARSAAHELVAYLDRWTRLDQRAPAPLAASLAVLAQGLRAIAAEVDGYDSALAAAIEALDRLISGTPLRARGRRGAAPPPDAPSGTARIDPRSVRARVLRLGPAADSAEIQVVPVRLADRAALRVRVPAFEPLPKAIDLPDLAVRLVHRRSGRIHGYGLLGLLDRVSDRCFEVVVCLTAAAGPRDVRVELHDAEREPPPVLTDNAELCRVRRATLFLAGWRALVADTRLWGANAAPTSRLQAVVGTLAPHGDEPLWSCGPSVSHLKRIAELGDRPLAAVLRGGKPVAAGAIAGDDGGAAEVVNSVAGPGDLLAAELAAAYERAVPA